MVNLEILKIDWYRKFVWIYLFILFFSSFFDESTTLKIVFILFFLMLEATRKCLVSVYSTFSTELKPNVLGQINQKINPMVSKEINLDLSNLSKETLFIELRSFDSFKVITDCEKLEAHFDHSEGKYFYKLDLKENTYKSNFTVNFKKELQIISNVGVNENDSIIITEKVQPPSNILMLIVLISGISQLPIIYTMISIGKYVQSLF